MSRAFLQARPVAIRHRLLLIPGAGLTTPWLEPLQLVATLEKSASLPMHVTARREPSDLVRLVDPYSRHMNVVVVLFGDDAPQTLIPKTRTTDASTLAHFAHKRPVVAR